MENSEQPVNKTAQALDSVEVSVLLQGWSDGDRAALDRLTHLSLGLCAPLTVNPRLQRLS